MNNVRVRFAPSPTGPLHIGGVRTALYNYLFARKHNGTMILRIEDTDQSRYVPGAEEYIMESLDWCGIKIDEGVREGGPFAPYKQSERAHIYRQFAIQLVEKGHAYYAFDTPDELEQLRKASESGEKPFVYNFNTRTLLHNSLTLSESEVSQLINNDKPYVIRFKVPEHSEVVMQDIVRGTVVVKTDTLDDKVLFKSDGLPTYHLANIVDDHLMQITHVIRGEEWLPSLPLHILLYKAFEWQPPIFAHLPLLLKPDGNGKLSKRDGDRLGFPVFPLKWVDPLSKEVSSGYRESGYFPDAFVNMLALLGWNSGTEQELFSMLELTNVFSLERVGKSGAKFDPDKTRWFNHQYLLKKPLEELSGLFAEELTKKGIQAQPEYVHEVVSLVRDRVAFVKELWDESFFFFEAPKSFDEQVVQKRWKAESAQQMQEMAEILGHIEPFDTVTIDQAIKNRIAEKGYNTGAVMNVIRLLLVGTSKGPYLSDIMQLIGREETISRVDFGTKALA